ncbi:MAG TPA: amino acid ABC transporter permease [Rectinemataceae bacterium]|nr:amino acid ABC transporter permease [Rectinemataceae bacterium]
MSTKSAEEALFENPDRRTRALIRVGTAIAALAMLALIAAIVLRFYQAGQLAPRYWEFFAWGSTWKFLLSGLIGTLASAAMAAAIALTVGLVFMAGRLSKIWPIRWAAVALIEFFRGVPSLLLIYFCFLILPSLGFKMSSYWMVTLPIGLNTAAVVAEVYRSGVLAVPRGQRDAAVSLALNGWQTFFDVIFPQAIRYVVPSLLAQLVIVVKDTTFGYVVTYGELMQNAKVLVANYNSLVPVYLIVAVIYCLLNYSLSKTSRALNNRMGAPATLSKAGGRLNRHAG